MLILTTAFQIAVGLLAPLLIARALHHRRGVPYALLIPGLIPALILLLLDPVVQSGLVGLLAGLPATVLQPVIAGGIGLAGGLLAALALTLTFAYLARGVVTVPQALMVGIGFGSAEVMLRAGLAVLVLVANLRLIDQAPAEWGLPQDELAVRQADLDAYFSRSPIEPLLDAGIALMQIARGAALTLLVALMFLTGQIGWFFGAFFFGALTASGQVMFARAGPVGAAVWWAVVGVASLIVLWRASRHPRPA